MCERNKTFGIAVPDISKMPLYDISDTDGETILSDEEESEDDESMGSLVDFIALDDEVEDPEVEELPMVDTLTEEERNAIEAVRIQEEVTMLQREAERFGAPAETYQDAGGCRRSTRPRKRPRSYVDDYWGDEERDLYMEDVDSDELSEEYDEYADENASGGVDDEVNNNESEAEVNNEVDPNESEAEVNNEVDPNESEPEVDSSYCSSYCELSDEEEAKLEAPEGEIC